MPPIERRDNFRAATQSEQALLLACSRTLVKAEDMGRIREMAQAVAHWPALMEIASSHKVWPLVYHTLTAICPDAVPQDILETLRRESQAHGIRNLRHARELARVLKPLEAQSVPCIPYKGPVLADSIYGDLSLRQFADLDILVPRRDVARAMPVLQEMGYAPHEESSTPAAYLQSMHHYSLQHKENKTILELHWDIAERYFAFSMPMSELWERRETTTLMRQPTPTLSAEDLLIILAIHGCKHGWEQLGLICDIAELARARQDMNWDAALRRARERGGERMVLLALALAQRLLGAQLPDIAQKRFLADAIAERLADEVQQRLFSAKQTPPDGSERVRFFRFHIQARERLRDQARSCLHLIFTPSQEDWASVRFPPALAFLYYPFRPIRLAGKYIGRLVRRS